MILMMMKKGSLKMILMLVEELFLLMIKQPRVNRP